MALDIRSLDIVEPTDLVMHPEELKRISITHDGVSVSYMHDDKGWYTFGAYKPRLDNKCECIEVTAETVIAELIRAIALSMEESVQVWLE